MDRIASAICRDGEALGIPGSLALAYNPDTAVLLARHRRGVTIVPRGQEADFLSELPLQALLEITEQWFAFLKEKKEELE